jgi:hypothetical protein
MLTNKTKAAREAKRNGVLLAVLPWNVPEASGGFWVAIAAARLWRQAYWLEEPSAFLVALAEDIGKWYARSVHQGLRLAVVLPDEDMACQSFYWANRQWQDMRECFPLCDIRISDMQ